MQHAPAIALRNNSAPAAPPQSPAGRVAAVLERPDAELDHAKAKLAVDSIVDPSLDAAATMAEIEAMAATARIMAGPAPSASHRLTVLRTLIYESGPWNGHRPFAYDHENFSSIPLKLIANYLRTRRGTCVSMPVLFLILADKVGLDVALATAPGHLYLRHRDQTGHIVNLEPTSGGGPARDVWIRRNFRISDRAIETGLYMRSLSRREGVALMAETVVHKLKEERRWDEAVAVCEVILRHSPRDAFALSNLGAACANLLRTEFLDRYRSQFLIPLPQRARYSALLHKNHAAFAAAEALGWERVE